MDIQEVLARHKKWLENDEGGQRADLRGADLHFSCWPLWCGSKGVIVDLKVVYQLLAHVACLDCDELEFAEIKSAIMPWAVKSHRAMDLGLSTEGEA